jgi:hypothetical protein
MWFVARHRSASLGLDVELAPWGVQAASDVRGSVDVASAQLIGGYDRLGAAIPEPGRPDTTRSALCTFRLGT